MAAALLETLALKGAGFELGCFVICIHEQWVLVLFRC